ncbi:all-trans-retinol 13,14-reductase [Bacteroidia bacterium]|nr:all-trans-retinol 13,14-reductase [Bacteroidia bacterium]
MDKHVIIIGSGLGGLACGHLLAKAGFRVTVLEKNAQTGGCLQTFVRKGVKFETGMHYIGSMDEGQPLHRLFDGLGLLPRIQLQALDRDAYDIISIGGERYAFANGQEACIDSLARQFPAERGALQQYWATVNEVAAASPLASFLETGAFSPVQQEHIHRSASAFIEQTTANTRLRQVLAGNTPLYGGVRGKSTLYIHALIRDFYTRSAYRIVGGSDIIAHTLIRSIRQAGGEVRPLAQAMRINCNEREARSVTLHTGEVLEGSHFISAIHPARTLELLDTPLIRRAYRERITGLRNTVSNFTVYIRFKDNRTPYLNANFFHFNTDVWEAGECSAAGWPQQFLYMHLCSSPAQQFATAAVLMANMDFSEVARWKGTAAGRRGEAYEAFKQEKATLLLDSLEKQFPGTRANIEAYYTSSPLTYLDYTGTEEGSTYGLLHDSSNPLATKLSHRTKIPNLLLTGQNIHSHGILGVLAGAFITANELKVES